MVKKAKGHTKKKGLVLPSKLKFKKPSKRLSNLQETTAFFKSSTPRFGKYAIQAVKACFMSKGQIEAGRVSLRRPLRGSFRPRIWVNIKPTVIVTKRALETRMGRGKGAPSFSTAMISPGEILYEIRGPKTYKMRRVFEKMKQKIATPTKLIVF